HYFEGCFLKGCVQRPRGRSGEVSEVLERSGETRNSRLNGPRLGDSGGLENLNFQSCTYLSNSLLLFSKFMKKGNIKDCCDKKKEKLSISPLNRHFANGVL